VTDVISRQWILFTVVFLLVSSCTISLATPAPVQPFESSAWSTPANVIDSAVASELRKHGIQFRNPCSDAVFIRRIYLDAIGTLPTPKEVDAFLADPRPDKRAALVDALLRRDEFAQYWTIKWCDILRVKSEFPNDLWPNAVQAYSRWVYEAIRENLPYDRFARELLTSSGSNFRVPAVNFYRAVQGREPSSIAKVVALTLMGTRIESWPKDRRDAMAALFSRVAYKKTDEWKEEIVLPDPAVYAPLKAVFPDGTSSTIPSGEDPREAFADWLISSNNQWFARNIVNRIWGWTMGRGIINEVDDIRPDNPPASPLALACLQKELIKSNYDLHHIYRLIFDSRTYQQSSIPHNDDSDSKVQFAHYTARQLDAEVLLDALCWIGGEGEGYESPIPEPYTFIPKTQRTIALADGSITSQFLTIFGRSSRDYGLASERNAQPTGTQRLFLLNSSDVRRKIDGSKLLDSVRTAAKGNRPAIVRGIYEIVLSRFPTPAESATAEQYLKAKAPQPKQAASDLAWALINTKEFLNRH
jgi:hypothetical protein